VLNGTERNRPGSAEHRVVFVEVGEVLVQLGDAAEVLRLDGWSFAHRSRRPALSPVQHEVVTVDRRPPAPAALGAALVTALVATMVTVLVVTVLVTAVVPGGGDGVDQ